MKKQKIIALVLAVAVSSVSISAATTNPTNPPKTEGSNQAAQVTAPTTGTEIIVGSTLHLPTIDVTIGNAQNIVVNPYKMAYNLGGSDHNDSLISTVTEIQNNSTIGVTIKGSPKAELQTGANIDFLTSTPAAGTTFTDATLYMELQMAAVSATVPTNAQEITNVSGSIQKAEVSPTSTASATIELAAKTTTPTYGAYLLKGESYGTWRTGDLFNVKLTFDISPKIGSTGTAAG